MFTKEKLKTYIENHFSNIKIFFTFVCPATIVASDVVGELELKACASFHDSENPYYIIQYRSKVLKTYVDVDEQEVTLDNTYKSCQEMLNDLDNVYNQIVSWEKQAANLKEKINTPCIELENGYKLKAKINPDSDCPGITICIVNKKGDTVNLQRCEYKDDKLNLYQWLDIGSQDYTSKSTIPVNLL